MNDIGKAFDTEIPRFLAYTLLGLSNVLTFSLHSLRGRQMALALLAARQTILAQWGSTNVPDHMAWLHRLWLTLAMERLSLVKDHKGETLCRIMGPIHPATVEGV